jgi:hypothetical protein
MMAKVRMYMRPAGSMRKIKKLNRRWARQRPSTRGAGPTDDHGGPDRPVPTITTVAPATGVAAGGTNVTITGTNFTGATGVTFGGVAGTTFVVVSATSITVRTPAHAVGAVSVVVTHPNGNATKASGFTYT